MVNVVGLNSNNNLSIMFEKYTDNNILKAYIKIFSFSLKSTIYAFISFFKDKIIEFSSNEFILKCTHDSGSVAICKDKSNFDFEETKAMLLKGLERNQFYLSREWPYKNIKPCVICEKLLTDDTFDDIQDYKFFCFDGKVEFFAVYTDRHSNMKITYYYPGWERVPMKLCKYPVNTDEDFKPKYFDKMFEMAEKLAEGFPHVRVDFYYVNDKIYFGEMTFFSSGGRLLFEPDEYNYKFGEMIHLPPKMR